MQKITKIMSVPSKKNPDYQFRIDEGINTCKRLQKSFSDKGADYRGMTVVLFLLKLTSKAAKLLTKLYIWLL